MQAMEQERLKVLEQQQAEQAKQEADDSLFQDLDNQLKILIQVSKPYLAT